METELVLRRLTRRSFRGVICSGALRSMGFIDVGNHIRLAASG